jgi:hypothetical protein
MAIDIKTEPFIDLDEAAKLFPGKTGGTVHRLTVRLYSTRGKYGVVLESWLAGPRRVTTVAAVERFIEAVTAAANGMPTRPDRAPVANRTKREQAAAARRACRELEAAGA